MSLRKPSKVSPTTGSDHASSSAEAAAIASRTTPTLKVFVIPIGVVRRPDSRTHSSPVSSPFPLSRWQPEKTGVSVGTTIVTRTHGVTLDQRRVTDAHTGHIGDGVLGSRNPV